MAVGLNFIAGLRGRLFNVIYLKRDLLLDL